VSEDDLYDIKKKSLELGIPYQNLIQGLIHKFNAGEIRLV
jgi:predicted DNA binding CopG/RHH family protein